MNGKSLKRFSVTYIDRSGEEHTDIMLGFSSETVTDEILTKGYTPLKVRRILTPVNLMGDTTNIVRVFFKNLTDLLKSGYSLNESIEVLYRSEKNPTFRSVLYDIYKAVSKGHSLSESISSHSEWFSLPIRTMINTGEQSGKLMEVLDKIVDYIDKETELSSSLLKELSVPLLTLLFGIAILFFNVFVTIPKIMKSGFYHNYMEKSAGIGIVIMQITAKVIPIVFVLLGVGLIVLFYFYKTQQEKTEKILAKVPLIREIWFNREIFLLYFSLSKLLSVGVNLDDALDIVSENVNFKSIKRAVKDSAEKVRQGMDISETLPVLDEVDKSLVRNITTTKKLADVFHNISDRKYEEYRRTLKLLPSAVRTVTYIILTYLFFLIFLGVIVPYYKSINNAMGRL